MSNVDGCPIYMHIGCLNCPEFSEYTFDTVSSFYLFIFLWGGGEGSRWPKQKASYSCMYVLVNVFILVTCYALNLVRVSKKISYIFQLIMVYSNIHKETIKQKSHS